MTTDLDLLLRAAVRRVRFDRALRGIADGLRIGMGAGLVVLAADRVAALALPWWMPVAVVGLGGLAGAWRALAPAIDRVAVAARLDRAFDLSDRLGSAMSLAAVSGDGAARTGTAAGRFPRVVDPAFSALLQRDAEVALRGLNPRSAIPVSLPRSAAHAVVLAVPLTLGWVLLPDVARSSPPAPPEVASAATMSEEDRNELADTLAEAASTLAEEETTDPASDAAADDASVRSRSNDVAETLDRLAAQLDRESSGNDADDPDAAAIRDEAVRELNDAATELDQRADRADAALDELTERFNGLTPPPGAESADPEIERLVDELRRGAFDDAANTLDQLSNDAGSADPAERQRRAEALRQLAEQARARAESNDDDAGLQERQRRLDEALEQLGATPPPASSPESAPESDAPVDPDAVRDALEQAGADPELAEQLTDEAQRLREEQERRDQIARDAESVERSLEEAADRLDREPSASAPPPEPPGVSEQPEPQDPGSQPGQEQPGAQPGQEQPGAQPGQEQPGAQPGQEQPGAQPGQEQPGAQPGQEQPGAQPGQEQPGAQPGQEQPGAQPGQEQPGTQPGQEQPAGAQPGQEQPGAQPGQQQPNGQPSGQSGTGGDGAGDTPGSGLRELGERRREAAESRQQADEAREFARRVGESLTPEERDRFAERFARRDATSAGPADESLRQSRSQDVDLSTPNPDGDSVGTLPGRGDGPLRGPDVPGPRAAPANPAAAARTAERAVAERRIPDRYHDLIRRYFDRLRETDAPAGAPPATSGGEGSGS